MKHVKQALDGWSIRSSAELYGIRSWSKDFFQVNDDGLVTVRLNNRHGPVDVPLMDIVSGLNARGMGMPVLLRFADILGARIAYLNQAFASAIKEAGYKGGYRGVYPIKVNQQQEAIQEITRLGRPFHHGLEAGSKAELMAALAYLRDPDAFLVCNGYKDSEFIDLALYGQKMGLQTIIVVEMPGELDLIIERAARIGIRPRLGVRIKLSSRAGGKWTESGGDRSVFGLNTAQVIDLVDDLRRRRMLDCLEMMHYHLGSQIPNIRDIRSACAEAARFYVGLAGEGARMGIMNIGGGLAIDYDGSHTNFTSSANYDLAEYCADIIEGIMSATDAAGINHPLIISESGRALVGYYSVLLFNILDSARFESHGIPAQLPKTLPPPLDNLLEVASSLRSKNLQEFFHDAVYYRDEAHAAFLHGDLSLRLRALADQVFWHVLRRIVTEARKLKHVPEELQGLESVLADVYYANMSVFQSLPDAWAIGQLFPIMPIHRLNERPTRQACIADITCDCDGKIDQFIDLHDVQHSLTLHELRKDEPYVLGAFLVGAYQETLGDLHNLFGDTHVASIKVDDDGEIVYDGELSGDSVGDVLSYVEYEPARLMAMFRQLAEDSVKNKRITLAERREILVAFDSGLRGYTYFEH